VRVAARRVPPWQGATKSLTFNLPPRRIHEYSCGPMTTLGDNMDRVDGKSKSMEMTFD